MNAPTATPAAPLVPAPESYDNYDAFLRQAIHEHYRTSWKSHRGTFIALIIASGQVLSLATDSVKDGSGLRKAALGAATLVALRLGVRIFFAGPFGVLLSAALLASAGAYLMKNQKEISGKVVPLRALVADTRNRFEEIQVGYRAGRYDNEGRNLMVEGLLKRFLDQVNLV